MKQPWGVVLIVKLSAVEYVLTTQERCSGSLGVDPWLPRDVKIRPITPHFDTRDVFGLIAPHSLLTMCWLCIMHAVEAKPSLNPRIANIGDLISHLAVHCIDVCMSYWAGVFEFHTLVLYYFFVPFPDQSHLRTFLGIERYGSHKRNLYDLQTHNVIVYLPGETTYSFICGVMDALWHAVTSNIFFASVKGKGGIPRISECHLPPTCAWMFAAAPI